MNAREPRDRLYDQFDESASRIGTKGRSARGEIDEHEYRDRRDLPRGRSTAGSSASRSDKG